MHIRWCRQRFMNFFRCRWRMSFSWSWDANFFPTSPFCISCTAVQLRNAELTSIWNITLLRLSIDLSWTNAIGLQIALRRNTKSYRETEISSSIKFFQGHVFAGFPSHIKDLLHPDVFYGADHEAGGATSGTYDTCCFSTNIKCIDGAFLVCRTTHTATACSNGTTL